MASLWRVNGCLMPRVNGRLERCETCQPCPGLGCDEGGMLDVVDADPDDIGCRCQVLPRFWSFPLSGITNGDCLDCDSLNETVTVTHLSSVGCVTLWKEVNATTVTTCTPPTIPPLEGTAEWQMTLGYGSAPDTEIMNLSYFNGVIDAILWSTGDLPTGTINCLGPNVLTKDPSFDTEVHCTNYPNTITVSPA